MEHKLDARMLEYSHNYVHFFIGKKLETFYWLSGGDMSQASSASNDVIFIYHHSMVDNIFEQWRQNKQVKKSNSVIRNFFRTKNSGRASTHQVTLIVSHHGIMLTVLCPFCR